MGKKHHLCPTHRIACWSVPRQPVPTSLVGSGYHIENSNGIGSMMNFQMVAAIYLCQSARSRWELQTPIATRKCWQPKVDCSVKDLRGAWYIVIGNLLRKLWRVGTIVKMGKWLLYKAGFTILISFHIPVDQISCTTLFRIFFEI